MEKPAGTKSEKPTAKRLREARRKGQIPRSPDLVGWTSLLVATFVIPPILRGLASELTGYYAEVTTAVGVGQFDLALAKAGGLIFGLGLVLLPFLVLMVVTSSVGLAVQGGVTITADPLKPKWERISPKAGLKRLVSTQSLVDTAKAVIRLVAIVVLVAQVMTEEITSYLGGTGRNMEIVGCLLYTSPSPRDRTRARMPSSA